MAVAVVTSPCSVFPCVRAKECPERTFKNGWSLKSSCDFIKTQLCTLAICLTLFNSVRLPREAFRYGPVPYLVVYSFWVLVVAFPTVLLELSMGQLSQQDPVGVWRAVPILRGVGHLKVMTSYLCCVYNMMLVALSAAYLIWIGKGTFPLRDCTRLHMTPEGYKNKMNASECFNATFLAPFTEYPQYLGIMAILMFILWFFVPIFLLRLRKSLKVALSIFASILIIMIIVVSTFLSDRTVLTPMFLSCEKWTWLAQPYIWHSALVQALLSTQIVGGYLISAGGTIYRQSDVRWSSVSIVSTNIIAGWLWVLFWEAIGSYDNKDMSFISILVLIYQASVSEKRSKQWPLLQYGILFFSSIITVLTLLFPVYDNCLTQLLASPIEVLCMTISLLFLTLLFPVYDKLHRVTGDHWRLFATAASAVGTVLSVVIFTQSLDVATIMDEIVLPVLAVFTTALEVVGFVFIYGWCYLSVDINFLTRTKLPGYWAVTLWLTPVFIIGITGWWLRSLLNESWTHLQGLWPMFGVFIGILMVMVVMAAIAVAKEEQFNLCSKIASAFRPSRLWGPEEPMARYVWMSQRYANETSSSGNDNHFTPSHYAQIISNKDLETKYYENYHHDDEPFPNTYYVYTKNDPLHDETVVKDVGPDLENHNLPRTKMKEEKFRSPNICIAKGNLGAALDCNCNRHFTLNVPDLRNNEITTSL